MNKIPIYQLENTMKRFDKLHTELVESLKSSASVSDGYLSDVNFLYWTLCEKLEDFLSSNARN